MPYYVKHGGLAVIGVALSAGGGWLLAFAECLVLGQRVYPAANRDIAAWIADFWAVLMMETLAAVFLTFLWHLLALVVADGRRSDGRFHWFVLLAVTTVFAVISAALWVPRAEQGALLAALFAAIHAPLVFWLGTVLLTPPSVKFAPVLAAALRRGW